MERYANRAAVRRLIPALYDPNPHRRLAAARALGWIPHAGSRAAKALIDALSGTVGPDPASAGPGRGGRITRVFALCAGYSASDFGSRRAGCQNAVPGGFCARQNRAITGERRFRCWGIWSGDIKSGSITKRRVCCGIGTRRQRIYAGQDTTNLKSRVRLRT